MHSFKNTNATCGDKVTRLCYDFVDGEDRARTVSACLWTHQFEHRQRTDAASGLRDADMKTVGGIDAGDWNSQMGKCFGSRPEEKRQCFRNELDRGAHYT